MSGGILMPDNSPPALTVASPFNDTQLVAMIAAHFGELPVAEAVNRAKLIVVESCVQTQNNALPKMVKARIEKAQ